MVTLVSIKFHQVLELIQLHVIIMIKKTIAVVNLNIKEVKEMQIIFCLKKIVK